MCAQLCDVCPPIWCLLKRDVGLPLQYNVCSTEIVKIPCPLSSNLLPIPPPPVTNPTHSSPLWFQMQFSIFFCFEKQWKFGGTTVRFPFSYLAKCEKQKKFLFPLPSHVSVSKKETKHNFACSSISQMIRNEFCRFSVSRNMQYFA